MEMLFEERQKFNQWWLWVILLVFPLLSVFPFDVKEVNYNYVLVGIAIPLVFYFFELRTFVTEEGLHYQFFPFHFKKHIIKIEEIRNKITQDDNNYSYDYESLCKGLINEFFLILSWINEYFDNKINIYFSKSNNIHHYDNEIFLTNLNIKSANPKYSLDNNNFLIDI